MKSPLKGAACLTAALALLTPAARAQVSAAAAPVAASSFPSDAEIRALLVDRVDVQRKSVGMVVGIVTPEGRRVVAYGQLNQGDPRPLDGNTVFEIGSVTKIFTALLLADMVHRGEVALADPAAKYLPGVTLPEHNGRAITLADLATHTSGLPFAPPELQGDSAAFFGYTTAQLDAFLATRELTQDPGALWGYSNLGVGLLGRALAHRAGMDYETLVRSRITAPLGMDATAITLSPPLRARMATGHDSALAPAPPWILPALAGAGSLRSSANDLLTLLGAFLGYTHVALAPAMAAMLETRRPGPNLQQALGWWVITFGPGDDGIVTHGGGTFGFACSVAYDPTTRIGVVVLSNGVANDGGLAWHLLRPAFPYATAAADSARRARQEVALDTTLLDGYVGQYQPETGGVITITRRGGSLVFTSPSAPQGLRLHAESARVFFITEADLKITFEADRAGRPTGLIVHFGGSDTRVPRLEGRSR